MWDGVVGWWGSPAVRVDECGSRAVLDLGGRGTESNAREQRLTLIVGGSAAVWASTVLLIENILSNRGGA